MDRTVTVALVVGGSALALALGGAAWAARDRQSTPGGSGESGPGASSASSGGAPSGQTVVGAGGSLWLHEAFAAGQVSREMAPSTRPAPEPKPKRGPPKGRLMPGHPGVPEVPAELGNGQVLGGLKLVRAISTPRRDRPHEMPEVNPIKSMPGGEVYDPRRAWRGGSTVLPADPNVKFPFDAVELYARRLRGAMPGRVRDISGVDVFVYGAVSPELRDRVRGLRAPDGTWLRAVRRVHRWLNDESVSGQERDKRRRHWQEFYSTALGVDVSVVRKVLMGDDCCKAGSCHEQYGLPCQAIFAWTAVFPVITNSAANIAGGGMGGS